MHEYPIAGMHKQNTDLVQRFVEQGLFRFSIIQKIHSNSRVTARMTA